MNLLPIAIRSNIIFGHFTFFILCVLPFGYCNDDSRDILDCFDERFDSVIRWNFSLYEQEEFDSFVDNITSLNDDADRCIQLFLTGKAYELDIIRIMGLKLGNDGGLVIIGGMAADPWPPAVRINCVANATNLEDLRNSLKPLANVSLVVLDGLLFTECPVPVVLEEISTVIVQNCMFM